MNVYWMLQNPTLSIFGLSKYYRRMQRELAESVTILLLTVPRRFCNRYENPQAEHR